MKKNCFIIAIAMLFLSVFTSCCTTREPLTIVFYKAKEKEKNADLQKETLGFDQEQLESDDVDVEDNMVKRSCDLLIENAKIIDVFSHKIRKEKGVLIKDGKFIGFLLKGEKVEAKEVVDGKDEYLLPGFINGHVHIESSHLTPNNFAKAVIHYGTTTVIADPHEIVNVCGLDGFDYMYEATENLPLSVFFNIPSCVPATPFETSGAILNAADIKKRINKARVLGLGEMMNYPGAINDDKDCLEKIKIAKEVGKNVDGHAPMVMKADLDKYIGQGIKSDHECTTKEELQQRFQEECM